MRLADKTILVTGGGTGLGMALATRLADRGNRVVICGRRQERIDAALKTIHGGIGLACDLTDNDELRRLVDFVFDRVGGIDILINNAGVQVQTDLTDSREDFADFDRELATNLAAPLKLTRAFLPSLLGRDEAAIVNICSLLAIMPKPNAPGYCASKAGMQGFTESLRLRLAGTSVRVALVFPPLVESPMTHGRRGKKMSADAFAQDMLRQLERDQPLIRVGQARMLYALHGLSPSLTWWWVRRISAGTSKPGD